MWWKNRFKDWDMFEAIIWDMVSQGMFTEGEFVLEVLEDATNFTTITSDRIDFTLTRILDGFKFPSNKFAYTYFLAIASKIEDKIDYYNKNVFRRLTSGNKRYQASFTIQHAHGCNWNQRESRQMKVKTFYKDLSGNVKTGYIPYDALLDDFNFRPTAGL